MKNSLIGFINHKTGRRTLINVLVILALSFILSHFLPENIEDYGILVCIPAVFLVVYIFLTKRILESLVLASFIGFIMISKGNLSSLFLFSDVTLETLMSEDIAWLIIVCGLMGCIIALIEKSGGTFAFGNWVA